MTAFEYHQGQIVLSKSGKEYVVTDPSPLSDGKVCVHGLRNGKLYGPIRYMTPAGVTSQSVALVPEGWFSTHGGVLDIVETKTLTTEKTVAAALPEATTPWEEAFDNAVLREADIKMFNDLDIRPTR